MKKFNWLTAFVLNVVTCGIYSLYMWYIISENNNKIAEASGVQTIMKFIPAFLLGCVTCGIFLIVWMYQFQKQQVEIAKANGTITEPVDSPVILMIILFVPIYSYYVMCENYNRVVDVAPII